MFNISNYSLGQSVHDHFSNSDDNFTEILSKLKAILPEIDLGLVPPKLRKAPQWKHRYNKKLLCKDGQK